MIADAVKFLRDRLNQALSPQSVESAGEELVVYARTDKDEVASFKPAAVSIALVGLEEEKILRPADQYVHTSAQGVRHRRIDPEIRMNLQVLFVARFPDDYSRALEQLSNVISYFQSHRVFNHDNSPDLAPGITQLLPELITPTFAEQNEIWGLLRACYQPSVLYRIRMLLFRSEDGELLAPVKQVQRALVQVPT